MLRCCRIVGSALALGGWRGGGRRGFGGSAKFIGFQVSRFWTTYLFFVLLRSLSCAWLGRAWAELQYYPPRHAGAPVFLRGLGWLVADGLLGPRVLCAFFVYTLPPLPGVRFGRFNSLLFSRSWRLSRKGCRVGLRIVLFEMLWGKWWARWHHRRLKQLADGGIPCQNSTT